MAEPSRSSFGETPGTGRSMPSTVSMIDNIDDEMKRVFDSAHRLEDVMSPHASSVDLIDSVSRHHIDEDDYESHRKLSYPNIHHPLHPIRSHKGLRSVHSDNRSTRSSLSASIKEKVTPEKQDEADGAQVLIVADIEQTSISVMATSGVTPTTPKKVGFYVGSNTSISEMAGQDKQQHESSAMQSELVHIHEPTAAETFQRTVSTEAEVTPMFSGMSDLPTISEAAAKPMISVPSRARVSDNETQLSPKVTFHIGEQPTSDDVQKDDKTKDSWQDVHHDVTSKSNEKNKDHKHHTRHHHSFYAEKDLRLRRVPGSEVRISDSLKRVPTEKEEALTLKQADLEDMASHRLQDIRGIRRHKIPKHQRHSALSTIVHVGKKMKTVKPIKKYDHSPHEVFVELDELQLGEDDEWEWKEKARWIKFEEDVEEDVERWGKPHVASLSFHSLLELRRGLEQGTVLLDLEAPDFSTIANIIVDNMVTNDQLSEEQKGLALRVMMLKHRHVSQKISVIRRNLSYHNLQGLLSGKHSPSSHRRHQDVGGGFFRSFSKTTIPSDRRESSGALRKCSSQNSASQDQMINMEKYGNYLPLKEVKTNNTQTDKIDDNGTVIYQMPRQLDEHVRRDLDILRKIPKGAEATAVLVGAVDFLQQPAVGFVRLAEGVELPNLTEVPLPVRFMFVLLGPTQSGIDYHEIGRSISTLMSNKTFHEVAYQAECKQDILSAINEFLDESIVLPPGDWDRKTLLPIMEMARKKAKLKKQMLKKKAEEVALVGESKPPFDPLKRTGRFFGGLVNDIKTRYPKYWSDIKDALNTQCLASFFFIYFAALSPAITFGGLMSEITDNWIGVSEMILSSAVGGLVFALFAGQPLMIVGATGPIIVFEESMYKFCKDNEWEFLPIRVWIGVWCCLIAIIMVMLEGSFLVQFFTRFTQEIFASLISLIFIFETFKKLYHIYQKHPLLANYTMTESCNDMLLGNETSLDFNDTLPNTTECLASDVGPQPNTALLSTLLMMGTFFIAYFLRNFRNSKLLGRTARRALGDFGVPIAIIIMVGIDLLIQDTFTEKLNVPDGDISPTDPSKRGWLINPMGITKQIPIWMMFAAVIPALLVFILIFMETQITGTIVNKKERNLKKGSGYHLDLLLIGILPLVCTLLGLPIVCVAAVRSISHVSSLSVYSRDHAPGESPKLEKVHEQRVTAFSVSIMVGVSVLLGPVLKHIPVTVLFGVFLYMGVASMSGIQLFERLELLLTPVKHHPDVGFVRRVRTFKMNIFTLIQVLCLAILWAIKSTPASLGFPFVLILMVPLRLYVLPFLFTDVELQELDRDEASRAGKAESISGSDVEEDEPDFYEQVHMPV